jgi:hypothetical protein
MQHVLDMAEPAPPAQRLSPVSRPHNKRVIVGAA